MRGGTGWRLINFYSDIRDQSALNTLLSLDLSTKVRLVVFAQFVAQKSVTMHGEGGKGEYEGEKPIPGYLIVQ